MTMHVYTHRQAPTFSSPSPSQEDARGIGLWDESQRQLGLSIPGESLFIASTAGEGAETIPKELQRWRMIR